MIYEFVGLPATGKTTLINELVEKQLGAKIVLNNKRKIFFWYCYGFLRHPILFFEGVYLVMKYRPQLSIFWNYHVIRYAKLSVAELHPGVCFVDESPLSNVHSLLDKQSNENDIAYIYKKSWSLGIIVHMTQEERVRLERSRARNREAVNEYNPAWNEHAKRTDVFLQVQLRDRCDVLYVTDDNTQLVIDSIRDHDV
tara:strand:+ start:1623 stop:2213 length:591 start_codon:yes stop_codon:yes gene_type:complete